MDTQQKLQVNSNSMQVSACMWLCFSEFLE
uniref:Uncharacterized protein n=1 Tax=Rhizophora mucronata TaxID=61149 RepID=A0A2P2MU37_RHIMU